MSIAGSSSIRRLKDIAVVVGLHEFAPVGRRASGGRDGRRLERLAEVCQDLPDRPWVGDERDQPDVTATTRALQRKIPPTRAISFAQAIRARPSWPRPAWRHSLLASAVTARLCLLLGANTT